MRTALSSTLAVLVAAGCRSEVTNDRTSSAAASASTGASSGSSVGSSSAATSSAATGGSGGAGGREEWPCSMGAVYDTGAGGATGAIPGCDDPPGTEVLATDSRLLFWHVRLATDATHVYFGVGEGVTRVPKSGGAVEVFTDESAPALAVGTTHAYWSGWETGSPIRAKPLAGGAETTLADVHPQTQPWDVAADATDVYFNTSDTYRDPTDPPTPTPAGIFRVPALGGAPTKLADAHASTSPIAVDDESVYYFDFACPMRVAKSGGRPTLVFEPVTLDITNVIDVDAEAVYYAASYTGGGIVRVPKDGSTVTIVTHESDKVGHIAVDGDFVYWSDLDLHYIARTPKLGGPIEYLVGCALAPQAEGFAIDDGWLYWRSSTRGVLKRTPI